MIKSYIFLGAPGVGKGTMAKLLAEEKGMLHISTGDIFRNEIKNETKLGLEVKSIMAAGGYVPDELTNQILKGAVSTDEAKAKGFILDGYPRTLPQAKFLKENKIIINNVVLLDAPDALVIERILARGRGADDTKEVVKVRLDVYNEKTKPLIDYYKSEELLKVVDATGKIEENFKLLLEALK
ncbi:MAG: adenylate kinase [Mycoplasmataceae bacterium]|nr:adenylate kinase [Mycoplasmataceae bacterium]